ncbi:MAG: hypothetical protein CBC12_00815 [Candidatus Puniceispirillum sp. TMED52]|nr:MAG: hypothetical protein CBC12_00815 [Candidatus Puniceispirillum sp. TMED52]
MFAAIRRWVGKKIASGRKWLANLLPESCFFVTNAAKGFRYLADLSCIAGNCLPGGAKNI